MSFAESPYIRLVTSEVFRNCGVFLINETGHIVDENDVAIAETHAQQSWIGHSITELMPAEQAAAHRIWIKQVFTKPKGFALQLSQPAEVILADAQAKLFKISVIRIDARDAATAVVVLQNPEQNSSLLEDLILSSARFEAVLAQSPVPTALNDENGKVTYLNEAFVNLFGYTNKDIQRVDQWWPKAYPDPEYRTKVKSLWEERLDQSQRQQQPFEPLEVSITTKHGEEVIALVSAAPLENDFYQEYMVTLHDITEIRHAEQRLRYQNDILEHLNEGFHLTSIESLNIVYTNSRLAKMFGYEPNELIGNPVSQLNGGSELAQQKLAIQIKNQLQASGQWEGDVLNKRKDGSEFWCHALVKQTTHPQFGQCWVSIHQDINEQKLFHQRLWRESNFDNLTHLPNRDYFHEMLQEEISRTHQHHSAFALFFLDLDNFKEVNDLLGHQAGDAVLVETASRIEQTIRSTDSVARFGGDEFVLLIRDIAAERPSEVQRLAEKIMMAIAAPYFVQPETLQLTACIGMAIYPVDDISADNLLRFADQALYAAKANGKNNSLFFTDELQQQALLNRNLVAGLQTAIAQHELEVYYQPIVDAQTGRARKAEALLRWKFQGQYVSPAIFIPVAEETGLIHEIGHFVFEQMVKDAQLLNRLGFDDIQLSLNKSILQMNSSRIATEHIWPRLLETAGLSAKQFCIELTESSVLEASQRIENKFEQLHASGFTFAIDDFGTGYTSIEHLARYPFKLTKIDRSFITEIASDERKRNLVEGLIALSHKLHMKVVAEGIEQPEQLDLLRSFQCDYIQGYLIARPMPFSDFCKWLQEQ